MAPRLLVARLTVLPLAWLFSLSGVSNGQTAGTGALVGVVSDPSGAIIADAQVTATNEATGETRTVRSAADGSYLMALLLLGFYDLEIEKHGFKVTRSLTEPAVFSADDTNALGFGNSGVGIFNGPGQNNLDLSLSKRFAVQRSRENMFLEFRAEFFNAFNHPQFCDPDLQFTSPTFGHISCTSVAPRIVQLALKLDF